LLPWSTKESLVLILEWEICWFGGECASLKDECGGLAPVYPPLGCYDALLVVHWLPDYHLAVLEHCGCVAKNEVDGAGDGAISIELAVGVGIEGVLVPIHLAVIEDGHVGLDA